jgi:hypothetical protein
MCHDGSGASGASEANAGNVAIASSEMDAATGDIAGVGGAVVVPEAAAAGVVAEEVEAAEEVQGAAAEVRESPAISRHNHTSQSFSPPSATPKDGSTPREMVASSGVPARAISPKLGMHG